MKPLSDALKSLFGTSSESTPAVPSPLREAAAAEAASPPRYDYPRVRSIDDLPPDPKSPAVAPLLPGVAPFDSSAPDDSDLYGRTSDVGARQTGPNSDDAFVPEPLDPYNPESSRETSGKSPHACHQESALDDLLSGLKSCDPRAFSKRLQQSVREVHGGTPVAFYSAAGISRSAYSRLVSHPDRHPSKDTVLAMAAALRMSLPDAETFLRLAGYALSPHIPADLVWQHCFQQGIHDLSLIRKALVTRLSGPSC